MPRVAPSHIRVEDHSMSLVASAAYGPWEASSDESKDGFMKGLADVYAKHFTADEIRGLIAFYETPLGQRVLEEQPKITLESMPIGSGWGRRAGERAVERLRQKGYKVPDA